MEYYYMIMDGKKTKILYDVERFKKESPKYCLQSGIKISYK